MHSFEFFQVANSQFYRSLNEVWSLNSEKQDGARWSSDHKAHTRGTEVIPLAPKPRQLVRDVRIQAARLEVATSI